MNDHQLNTVHGLIIPIEWNKKGDVLDIAIATFDEDQYLIEESDLKNDLRKKIGQSVIVTGIVKEGDNKKRLSLF